MKRTLSVTDKGAREKVIPAARDINHYWSKAVGESILDSYISGESLQKIGETYGFPCYGTILKWLRDIPEFKEAFEKARALRALHFEEKARYAAEHAEDIDGKDRAALGRLMFDAYKWSAEVSDAARYGKSASSSSGPSNIQIVVNTGVPEQPAIEVVADGKK